MYEKMDTVIIGGGQAGLSLSYYLLQNGYEHVILEKAPRVADAWRNRRPDSFTLVSPNWSFKLPGAEYDGPEPEGFMPKTEIVERFERYERKHRFPVNYSTEVTRVKPVEGRYRYRVYTNQKTYDARNVVLATGMFQKVKVPSFAAAIPQSIYQVTSDDYRNPESLPPGAVLVVGTGQSGAQIAEELQDAGRKVFLSTGSTGRAPRRYRGRDVFHWLSTVGFFDRTPAMLGSSRERFFSPPHLSGQRGGHDLNLHQFHRQGITLLGHARGWQDGRLLFAPDLKENLSRADGFYIFATRQIDGYILKNGLDVPTEETVVLDDGFRAPVIESLDLAREGICSIVWACGYSMDFSMVELDLLDPDHYPSADQGESRHPGLYFLGMNWMNKMKSGFLFGIADSARHVAEKITTQPLL